ncbi:hypothetical protein ABZX92_39590 [Lentzea sp. NPDC006480]|uniref:hypothetical protein n=1 Tax=Lentzea sp. NPDC006480 TaxID=3157176 RepID=UPI0033B322F3
MKRFLPVLGALVLVAAVVAVVVWQRPDSKAALNPSGDVVLQYADGSQLWRMGDPETPVTRQVAAELSAKGVPLQQLLKDGGAIVVTTIDRRAQNGAAEVIRTVSAGEPASLRYSISAVDPNNGAVKAYSPGNDPAFDYAGGVLKEPGPAFFPFIAVAAQQTGKKLEEVENKSAVHAARQAGVPETVVIEGKETQLFGDETKMRPFDLAAAYATFAAEGMRRDAHFVTHVTDLHGTTLYRADTKGVPAFDPDPRRSKDIANLVTAALRGDAVCAPVPSDIACRHGEWRFEQDRVGHAWMVTYSPRISVSVFVGSAQPGTPAVDRDGKAVVGSGLPDKLWDAFAEKLTRW